MRKERKNEPLSAMTQLVRVQMEQWDDILLSISSHSCCYQQAMAEGESVRDRDASREMDKTERQKKERWLEGKMRWNTVNLYLCLCLLLLFLALQLLLLHSPCVASFLTSHNLCPDFSLLSLCRSRHGPRSASRLVYGMWRRACCF